FFFQAEDGIRDPLVTGVQTCALPISVRAGVLEALGDRLKVQLPSGFAGVGKTVEAAMDDKTVVPVENADQKIPGVGNIASPEVRSEERRVGKEGGSRGEGEA